MAALLLDTHSWNGILTNTALLAWNWQAQCRRWKLNPSEIKNNENLLKYSLAFKKVPDIQCFLMAFFTKTLFQI